MAQLLTQYMAAKCVRVAELVPMLRLKGGDNDVAWEEAINALLAVLVESEAQHLGWSVHLEDPGGFTAGPKWGSRDLTVKKNDY